MRIAVLLVAATVAGCASSPPRDEYGGLPPWAGQDKHFCGGTGGLRGKLSVEQFHATDPGSERTAIEIVSCCRGLLLIDGEPRQSLLDGKNASLDVPAGTHRIRIEIDGYRPYEVNVSIAPGERLRMSTQP